MDIKCTRWYIFVIKHSAIDIGPILNDCGARCAFPTSMKHVYNSIARYVAFNKVRFDQWMAGDLQIQTYLLHFLVTWLRQPDVKSLQLKRESCQLGR